MSVETAADPVDQAMVMLFSTHLLRAALKLGLPDALGEQPASVAELARRTGCDPETLHRLLRALTCVGVVQIDGGDRYAPTPVSLILRSSEVGKLIGQAATVESMWQAWSGLAEAVRTGECPFHARFGTDFYTYLRKHDPPYSAEFHAAMSETTEVDNDDVINALDLTAASRIVDVGGGQGGLLRDLLRRHRHLHGVLFDIPSVVPNAVAPLRSGEFAGRCEIVAGDARESVPAGADVYLLRLVLHNWDDQTCVRILSRCAEAASPGARIILVEMALAEDNPYSTIAPLIDIGMFVIFGARERTEADFVTLFDRAGLTYVGTTPTPSLHLIEARRDL